MPEGIRAGARDVERFVLNGKKTMAQRMVAQKTTTVVAIEVISEMLKDAAMLKSFEVIILLQECTGFIKVRSPIYLFIPLPK